MQDVDCGRFEEQASDYIENTLPPEQAAEVARHLRGCATCRQTEAALRAFYRDSLPPVETPLFFRENVLAAIEREQKTRSVAWWNAPAQWNRLTRTAVATGLATGLAAAALWSLVLPRTAATPTQTAEVLATPDTHAAAPTPGIATTPRLHLSRTLTVGATEGPAYDFEVWLSGAPSGTVRFRFPHESGDYRFSLTENQPQTLRVPLSVASEKQVLALTAVWSADGKSHTRHLFLPVATAARATPAAQQSFGLPTLTVADAAREIAARYDVAVSVDDAPDARIQINARQETALQTLSRHLEPLGLAAATGPDGIVIAPQDAAPTPTAALPAR